MAKRTTERAQIPAGAKHNITRDLMFLARPIDDITPDPENPYIHDGEQIDRLADILKGIGQLQPLVAHPKGDKIVLRDGHARLTAARQLGWTHIAVVVAESLSEAEALSYQIAANEATAGRKRDEASLARILKGMATIDRIHTGMTSKDLDKLTKGSVTKAPDAKGKTKITAEIECPHCHERFKK